MKERDIWGNRVDLVKKTDKMVQFSNQKLEETLEEYKRKTNVIRKNFNEGISKIIETDTKLTDYDIHSLNELRSKHNAHIYLKQLEGIKYTDWLRIKEFIESSFAQQIEKAKEKMCFQNTEQIE